MADNINFLQGIPIPQFGGGFAQQFTDFCNAVKNNFERLISIQYTKGNDGNSVEAKELIIDNNLEAADTLSVLGYGLVSTIFGNGAFKGDNDGPEDDYHDGLNNPWQGMLTKEQIQIMMVSVSWPIAALTSSRSVSVAVLSASPVRPRVLVVVRLLH